MAVLKLLKIENVKKQKKIFKIQNEKLNCGVDRIIDENKIPI